MNEHQAMMELRKFMFGSLYQNPLAKSEEAKADKAELRNCMDIIWII
mgnify:CR=1 FL=1